MKKMIFIILLLFLNLSFCYAKSDYISIDQSLENDFLTIVFKAKDVVHGFSAKLKYNNNVGLVGCYANNGFEVILRNNIIIYENNKGVINGLIGYCKFTINSNSSIEISSINISDGNSLHANSNLEINSKLNNSGEMESKISITNANENLKQTIIFVVLLVIIIIFALLAFIFLNKKLIKVVFISSIIICLIGVSTFSIKLINDMSSNDAIKNIILNNYFIYLTKFDLDHDKKITINDLILIKKQSSENINTKEPELTNESVTYNKTAIFFGDSITAGYLSDKYSWANLIKDNYDLFDCVNAGISDYRVSTYDDSNKWLGTQVVNHYNDNIKYDFVIMHGGINDLFYDTPLGAIANNFELSSFDSNTFIGGLETYIYKAVDKWPTSRIGYIINYYTPNYSERNTVWSIDQYKVYYNSIKKVLNKWGIDYIDLSEDEYSKILEINTTKYLPDKLHLNIEGYKLISPYIYDWMKTLKKYS